ncbi:MAG TPA: hypothetical protein VEA81_14940 [Burkholderiaceae bacterium]|nr:hypothetical protein [Burkholderiaceae bacterium]
MTGPTDTDPGADAAIRAAIDARAVAGDEAAAGDEARRDAFATLLYGIAFGVAMREPPETRGEIGERVDSLAPDLLRGAMRMGWRDATRTVEAIGAAIVEAEPDPSVLGLLQAGVDAAHAWLDGDRGAFEACVLQATSGEAFASIRPLKPGR